MARKCCPVLFGVAAESSNEQFHIELATSNSLLLLVVHKSLTAWHANLPQLPRWSNRTPLPFTASLCSASPLANGLPRRGPGGTGCTVTEPVGGVVHIVPSGPTGHRVFVEAGGRSDSKTHHPRSAVRAKGVFDLE